MFSLPREELAEALKGFRLLKRKKGASNAPLAIRVDCDSQGLRLSALRLDHTLSYTIPATPSGAGLKESFHLAMPHLEEAAKAADKKTDIAIDLNEKVLRYVTRGIEIDSPFHTVAETPDPCSEPTGGTPIPLSEEVMKAVAQATIAASADPGRAILNGIHLGSQSVTATNGRRLYTRAVDPLPFGADGIILPTHPVLKLFQGAGIPLLRLAPEPKKEGLLRRFELSVGPWTWSAFLVQGKYPNWRQVLPRNHEVRVRVNIGRADATRLMEVLPRLPGAKEKDSPIDLVIGDGRAAIVAGSNGSENRLVLEATSVSDAEARITVRFNGTFLVDSLRQDFRVLGVRDELSPIVMEDPDSARIHLWMPLRPVDPVPGPAPAHQPANGAAAESTATSNPTMRKNQPMEKNENQTNGAANGSHGVNRLNGNGAHPPKKPEERDPLELLLEEITAVKDALRENLARVNNLTPLVRQVGRDNKALEKEHRSLRRNLRGLKALDV